MKYEHISIMPDDCINGLNIKSNGIYVDATVGGAGHSRLICEKLDKSGVFVGIDRDEEALDVAKERLKDFKCQIHLIHSNYNDIKNVLSELHIDKVDGILADLGVSSYQLDNEERGFSYRFDSPLDMRMDKSQEFSAMNVVNEYDVNELTRILRDYGEEKFAYNIAKNIVKRREIKKIETTGELTDIVLKSMPKKSLNSGAHMEKRTFQAIRIEVNRELELLKSSVEAFFESLKIGGRLAVMTFHSLEDRIVKNAYNDFAKGCICPKEFPVCVCHNEPKGKIINKKPIIASEEEQKINSRSKSAKLRIIEKEREYEV